MEYLANTDFIKNSVFSKYAFFGDYAVINTNFPPLKYITYNNLQEQFLKKQYDQITSSEIELSKKLKEAYGDVSIDLQTGEITYP
jgi:hypothetical protein